MVQVLLGKEDGQRKQESKTFEDSLQHRPWTDVMFPPKFWGFRLDGFPTKNTALHPPVVKISYIC